MRTGHRTKRESAGQRIHRNGGNGVPDDSCEIPTDPHEIQAALHETLTDFHGTSESEHGSRTEWKGTRSERRRTENHRNGLAGNRHGTRDSLHGYAPKRRKRGDGILALLMILTFLFAMCVRTGRPELLPPQIVFHNLSLWIRLYAAERLHLPLALQRTALISSSPFYLETVARFRILAMTMICGAVIAMGGMVFQILFHNPMAAPSMLGVSSGVNLGLILLVVRYTTEAYAMTKERLEYCLVGAFGMLVLVMAAGRFAGKNRRSVTDMLLAGAVLSQLTGAVVTWIRFQLDQETLIIYQDLSLYGFSMNTTYDFAARSLAALSALAVVCVYPLYRMRFSFNIMSFSEEEAQMFGMPVRLIRAVGIILTTIVVTVAILFCGGVGALSLVVPHICRYIYGSRFETMLGHSIVWGAFLLLICRTISSLIYMEGIGSFPVATLVGLISAPILAVVLAQGRSGREQ